MDPKSSAFTNTPMPPKKSRNILIWIISIIVLFLFFDLLVYLKVIPIDALINLTKPTQNAPKVEIKESSVEILSGRIENIQENTITIKSGQIIDSFTLPKNVNIQKVASNAAQNKMSAPENISTNEIKKGDFVVFSVDRKTNQITSLLVN